MRVDVSESRDVESDLTNRLIKLALVLVLVIVALVLLLTDDVETVEELMVSNLLAILLYCGGCLLL